MQFFKDDISLKRIPAHKFVLSVGSAVFDAMFNGALGGNSDGGDIELPDVEPQVRCHIQATKLNAFKGLPLVTQLSVQRRREYQP